MTSRDLSFKINPHHLCQRARCPIHLLRPIPIRAPGDLDLTRLHVDRVELNERADRAKQRSGDLVDANCPAEITDLGEDGFVHKGMIAILAGQDCRMMKSFP